MITIDTRDSNLERILKAMSNYESNNVVLGTNSLGLACYWSTPKTILDANEFLGLDKTQTCYGLLYVGVPQAGLPLKSERGDIALKSEWIRSVRK